MPLNRKTRAILVSDALGGYTVAPAIKVPISKLIKRIEKMTAERCADIVNGSVNNLAQLL